MYRRVVSGLLGGVIVAIGIFLKDQFPDREAAIQVTIWSLLVFTMIVRINWKDVRERWFWVALCISFGIHALCVWALRNSLPFNSFGVAILMGILEAILLQGVFRVVSRS